MTVTADQAKILTTLGLAVRPYGAPHFDGTGINAQIFKVARMSLHEVALVVLAVCTDPTLDTPANIGDTRSRHWAGIHVIGAAVRTRDVAPVGTRCTVCDAPDEAACASRNRGDHEFTRRHEQTLESAEVARVKAEARAGIAAARGGA